MAGLTIDGIDWDLDVVHVVGKGRRARAVPFGARAGQALDRYLRVRRQHVAADSAALWLGVRGPMTRWGISQMLARRCDEAGLERIHPHQFRHTFAHAWMVKPTFELHMATRARSDEAVSRAIEHAERAMVSLGWHIRGRCDAPAAGRRGAREAFVHGRRELQS